MQDTIDDREGSDIGSITAGIGEKRKNRVNEQEKASKSE